MANVHTRGRSGFIRRDGVRRRETLWGDVARTSTALAASATAALINSASAGILALRPFTVVRTRGIWLCFSDQSAVTEEFAGNLGISVVIDQASAIGVTAVPTPATDAGSDKFFVFEQWLGRFSLIGSDVTTMDIPRPYDSRAMRKVEDGEDIVFTIEAGIGGAGVTIAHVGRLLLKLH